MAKISELTAIDGPSVNPTVDVIAIADISANKTKKLTPASLKSSMGFDIPTIAALKTIPVNNSTNGFQVTVGGYYTIGDGGGGQFWYDSTSTATDNGGTVISPVPPVATGRWLRIVEDWINVMWFGANGDANDTSAIQSALTFGSGMKVVIPKVVSYYKLNARITAPINTHIVMESGVELRWSETTNNGTPFLGLATRPGIEVTGDNFCLEGAGKLTGPSAASYISNEGAIFVKGTSTNSRRSTFKINGIEFTNWGSYAIFGQFIDNVEILGNHIHHCGYAGVCILSGSHGKIHGNHFDTFTPGTASNAFGITLGNDSTAYNSDPNANTNGRFAVNPFCIDWDVAFNLSENIPLWTGLDSHGGYGIKFHHNIVYNCKHGVHVACGSGDASNYGGEDNEIANNVVDSRKRDGTAGAANTGIGINVSGSSTPTVRHRRVRVSGNSVYGFGVVSDGGNIASIGASTANGVVVEGNIIESWGGVGVAITDSQDAIVSGNIFRQLANGADTIACAIRNQTATAVKQSIIGNMLDANGGAAAKEGFRTAATTRPLLGDNDFRVATVGAVVLAVGSIGSDLPISTSINLGAAGGTTVLNLAEFLFGAPEIIVRLTAGAAITITNITGVPANTRVVLLVENGSSNISFTRATSALGGSTDFVGNAYDSLSLMCYATSGGVQWIELARAING